MLEAQFPRRPPLGNRVNRGNGAALQAQTSGDERGFDQCQHSCFVSMSINSKSKTEGDEALHRVACSSND